MKGGSVSVKFRTSPNFCSLKLLMPLNFVSVALLAPPYKAAGVVRIPGTMTAGFFKCSATTSPPLLGPLCPTVDVLFRNFYVPAGIIWLRGFVVRLFNAGTHSATVFFFRWSLFLSSLFLSLFSVLVSDGTPCIRSC